MEIYLIDDGTLDTVVEIKTGQTIYRQRFDSDSRFCYHNDPDRSTEIFLDELKRDFKKYEWIKSTDGERN